MLAAATQCRAKGLGNPVPAQRRFAMQSFRLRTNFANCLLSKEMMNNFPDEGEELARNLR